MRKHPVDVDLQAAQGVVITWLQVRQGTVGHVRERGLPLLTCSLEVGQGRFPVHRRRRD